ncbi:TonB-dependent receptor [Pedobacter lusitanus]|nr:TonB-dependent receptor [Pedobacter lusitanus]
MQTGKLYAQEKTILEQHITINLKADTLLKVLSKLQSSTPVVFSYDPDLLRNYQTSAFHFVNTSMESVLKKIFKGTPLTFALIGNNIVVTRSKPQKWTIHGHVRNEEDGEELVGATVYIPEIKAGVITNQYGFYSLSVPAGAYEVRISNLGYETRKENIVLDQNIELETELTSQAKILQEIEVKQKITPNPLLKNEQNYSPQMLDMKAYYAGETDVVKALQMQNGIKTISEGSSGLFIRGGNSDQNLILLDEAVVYNPSHLYGLVSVFNPDAINNIQVYKDYMPANYGGRLSSVIVNRMAEGNNKEYHLSGGISLMSARISAEGPIVKEKGSFIVAFRRSLLDVFRNNFKLFNPNSVYYDINAKANYRLNKSNSIYYSLYAGQDKLLSENSFRNDWGNFTSTLRWNHIFNSRLFMNASAIYSNYSNLLDLNSDTLSQKSQWSTGVRDITIKADYTYYSSPVNLIKFGISSTYHQFTPGQTKNKASNEFNIARDKSVESAVYYSQEISFTNSFSVNFGLRLGLFHNAQERLDVFDPQGNRVKQYDYKTFIQPEPRINISYLLNDKQRFFVTYNRNYQYLQLVQNSTLAFSSLEPWIPASSKIAPQSADMFSAGYRYSPGHYNFSLNGYYKKLNNQLDLTGHAQIIQNPDIRNQLKAGKSDVYGFEAEISKTEGNFTGSLAYTYSRAFRTINGINDGNRFAANYDIPHELKFSAAYVFNKQFSVQTFFTYSSGRPRTLPVGYYRHDGINVPIFEGRNTSRFPNFSRLDISAQYRLETPLSRKRSLSSTISMGIYNLYNRKNPLYYHLTTDASIDQKSSLEYAFGFFPWVAYSFKF